MDCTWTRDRLPPLLYGDLPSGEAAAVERHLANCLACRQECAALKDVRRLLDAVPAPAIQLDLPRLYRQAALRQERKLGRWRRAGVALLAVAAMLLMVLALKLEVRLEGHQAVFRWGSPPVAPAPVEPSPPLVQKEAPPTVVTAEEVQLMKELIRALAADVAYRDDRQQLALTQLRGRLDALQRQAQQRWDATAEEVGALYTAQFGSRRKGGNP
jgi:hypothetical protein